MGHLERLWQASKTCLRFRQIWSRIGRKIISCAGVIAIVLLPYAILRFSSVPLRKVQGATITMGKAIDLNIFFRFYGGIPPWDPAFEEMIDPPPTSPTTSFIPLLFRQANCSLTPQVFDTSFNLQPQFIYPNYQDFLHQGSGLSTTPDNWANGCAQPTTGIASQQIETVQTQSNGNIVMAVVNISGNFSAANGQDLVIATISATTALDGVADEPGNSLLQNMRKANLASHYVKTQGRLIEGSLGHFHSKYLISTMQNVLEPVASGVQSTTITSTEEQSSSRRE